MRVTILGFLNPSRSSSSHPHPLSLFLVSFSSFIAFVLYSFPFVSFIRFLSSSSPPRLSSLFSSILCSYFPLPSFLVTLITSLSPFVWSLLPHSLFIFPSAILPHSFPSLALLLSTTGDPFHLLFLPFCLICPLLFYIRVFLFAYFLPDHLCYSSLVIFLFKRYLFFYLFLYTGLLILCLSSVFTFHLFIPLCHLLFITTVHFSQY